MHLLRRIVLAPILATGLVLTHGQTPAQNKIAEINKAELEKCLARLPAGTRHEHVMMPLRDGVKLATDVFRPAQGDGPWPIMLLRTPYSRFDPRPLGEMDREPCVLVVQNQRGRYGSEGNPPKDSFTNEVDDSHDAIEWCAKQKWCTRRGGVRPWHAAHVLHAVHQDRGRAKAGGAGPAGLQGLQAPGCRGRRRQDALGVDSGVQAAVGQLPGPQGDGGRDVGGGGPARRPGSANFPDFKAMAGEVIGIECELCSSDGGPRVDRTFVYSGPAAVGSPSAFGRVHLVDKVEPEALKSCGRALLSMSLAKSSNYAWLYGTVFVSPTIEKAAAKIEGKIIDADGKMRKTSTGSKKTVDGAGFVLWTGSWELFDLPPGTYTLELRVLDKARRRSSSRS